jgi:hypothetical protein
MHQEIEMDRLTLMEMAIEELRARLDKVEISTLSENEMLGMYMRIEDCDSFEELEMVSGQIAELELTKKEMMIFVLSARIKQLTIITEFLDDEIHNLQKSDILPPKEPTIH